MTQKDIEGFAALLESKGFPGAMKLIMEDLLPVARTHGLSLYESAKRYASCADEPNTSWHRLGLTLEKISRAELAPLDIRKPYTKLDIALE